MPERRITLKSTRELAIMREANRIVADTLVLLADQARPGVTTRELDDLATEHVLSRGAKPSFPLVNFDGTTCISINNEIVHGIPGKRVLRAGDIGSLDLGVTYQGGHGDAAITVPVGSVSPQAQRLLAVTARALALAIAQVPNYRPSQGGRGPVLRPGIVLAIEPMVNLGSGETVALDDGWTVVTKDSSLSAHFEHSVAVTAQGYEILSRPSDASRMWSDPVEYGLACPASLEKFG